jgi:cytochrome c biogenesis protein CcmG/thiol:disulfide interchange protein DsbE
LPTTRWYSDSRGDSDDATGGTLTLTQAARLAAASLILTACLDGASLRKEKDRKRAPDFELKDAAGSTVKLSDFERKVVLLDFWATWCGPCKTEIPWFSEFAEKYRDQGFAVVGVAMDEEGWSVIRPFMEKMSIKYPVLLGTKRAAYLYGDIESLPVTFLIDRDRRVAAIHVGLAKKSQLEEQIKTLLQVPAN